VKHKRAFYFAHDTFELCLGTYIFTSKGFLLVVQIFIFRLHFQTHQKHDMILPNNYIIKNMELTCQPWFILDFNAPLIIRDVEWKKVHFLFSCYYYRKHIQSFLSNQTKTNTSIKLVKITSIYQSAFLIAQKIFWKLKQKNSFQQIEKCQYVKGICIFCSNWLNDVEIAKTKCKKYDETSLHVFSNQIDYAKAQTSTPYEILGVKMWVLYFWHKKGQVVLYPKHIRFRKYQKGRFKGCKTNGTQLCFGKYGILPCEVLNILFCEIIRIFVGWNLLLCFYCSICVLRISWRLNLHWPKLEFQIIRCIGNCCCLIPNFHMFKL
jgi:hypothetical protein